MFAGLNKSAPPILISLGFSQFIPAAQIYYQSGHLSQVNASISAKDKEAQ